MLSNVDQRIRATMQGGKFTHYLWEVFALCLIGACIWLPRRVTLNRVVITDEINWFDRSGRFFLALKQGDYSETFQREHPGVTVMWIGAAAYEKNFQQYKIENPEYADRLTLNYFVYGIAKQHPLEILVESRKILALVDTLILLLAYWYARRIIGIGPALIGFALIAFDPFDMALTRVMHLDGLLANFYLLSLLAYISYTQNRNLFNLIISGVSAGLAWLTKSPGFFLVPTLGIVALLQLWPKLSQNEHRSRIRIIWEEIWPLVVWGLVGVFIFVATWPAMWVDPIQVISKVFGMAETYASVGHDSDIFFNGQIIAGSDFNLRYFYFYPLTFLWRATPVVIIGLFAFVLGFINKSKPLAKPDIRWFSTVLLIASIVFTLGMTLGQKKFDRYLIPAYPPLDILAGLGWVVCIIWVKNRLSNRASTYAVGFISAFVIVFQAGSSLYLFPNMMAYYNPLMGGGRKAPQVMQIGWGEGLDQAALYLNQKPDAENLVVSSWYSLGSFSFFFNGKVVNIPSGVVIDSDWQAIHSSDYIVIYVHEWQRNLPAELLSELANKTPEHSIWINGIEYVRIYKQQR